MARSVRSGPLESRTSRGKLKLRNAPYWCVLSPMLALGYRKGARGGSWLARLHDEETGKRIQERLGTSDDTLDSDGIAVLSFPQAQAKAREWFERKARGNAGELVESGPYIVADAMFEPGLDALLRALLCRLRVLDRLPLLADLPFQLGNLLLDAQPLSRFGIA